MILLILRDRPLWGIKDQPENVRGKAIADLTALRVRVCLPEREGWEYFLPQQRITLAQRDMNKLFDIIEPYQSLRNLAYAGSAGGHFTLSW